jgi:hypothetical protein
MIKVTLRSLADRWPSSVVARTEIKQFTGGLVNEKYMANLDSQGAGPPGRMRCGRKIAYPVDGLVEWLEKRTVNLDECKSQK